MPGRLRVLIADDNAGIVRSVSRLLALDYDVVGSVAEGSGLLDAARDLQPDVIVLDLSLRDFDGLKTCRQITQDSPEMRVIVFTAEDHPEVKRQFLAAGASAFVHKLSLDEDLLSALERLDVSLGG